MQTKLTKIIFLFSVAILSAGGVVCAQGFGNSAGIGTVKRLARVKSFQRPSGGKAQFLKSELSFNRSDLSFTRPSVSTNEVLSRIKQAGEQARKSALRFYEFSEARALHNSFSPKMPQGVTPLLASTFQANPSSMSEQGNSISGTVFKTTYNGQEEIYGVIPMHALGTSSAYSSSIGRHLTADVFDPARRKFIRLQGDIVQISSPEFLDAALVKFHKQDEHLLHPLSLNLSMPTWNTSLNSQGFAFQRSVYIPGRRVTKIEPFVFQTTIPYPRDLRQGLCGSAVTDETGTLVGIHNGSSCRHEDEQYDTGYVTPAWVFERLVQAYHNDGHAKVSIEVEEKTLIELNVDEYISEISLIGSGGMTLGHYVLHHKFSYSSLQKLLEDHYPSYIDFTVHRVQWNEDGTFVVDSRFDTPGSAKIYRYDTETETVELVVPSAPKVKKPNFFSRIFKRQ